MSIRIKLAAAIASVTRAICVVAGRLHGAALAGEIHAAEAVVKKAAADHTALNALRRALIAEVARIDNEIDDCWGANIDAGRLLRATRQRANDEQIICPINA